MKKILSFMLVFCLAFTALFFVGCTPTDIILKGGPAITDDVVGNGSFVVRKGEYVYFASGLVKTSEFKDSVTNEKGTVELGGLYRGKLVNVDGKQTLTDVELMVSKVVGSNNSGLYIFGDKIYFASPSTIKNSSGTVQYNLITFFSADLNGANLKELYQTTEFSSGNFSFISIDGNVYLLVFTGSDVLRVDMNGKAVTLVEDATSVILPNTVNISNNTYSTSMLENFVFYTKDKEKNTDERDFGNALYKTEIATQTSTEIFSEDYVSISLISQVNGKIFYTRNVVESQNAPSSLSYYFSNDMSNASDFVSTEIKIMNQSKSDISNIYIFANGEGFAYKNNSKLHYRGFDGSYKTLTTKVSSILTTESDYVYYIYSDAIYRINITEEDPEGVKLSGDLSHVDTTYFDLDGEYFFFFAEDENKKTFSYFINLTEFASGTSTATQMK